MNSSKGFDTNIVILFLSPVFKLSFKNAPTLGFKYIEM